MLKYFFINHRLNLASLRNHLWPEGTLESWPSSGRSWRPCAGCCSRTWPCSCPRSRYRCCGLEIGTFNHIFTTPRIAFFNKIKKISNYSTLCVIHSVVMFCTAFLACSTGRWADTAATVQPSAVLGCMQITKTISHRTSVSREMVDSV